MTAPDKPRLSIRIDLPGGDIAGTLIGRALLSKDVDLTRALEIAASEGEPVAEFQ